MKRFAASDIQRFCQLVAHLPYGQLSWLFSGRLYESIQVVDHASRTVRPASPADLPWPSAFLVAAHHESYRHATKEIPSWSELSESICHLSTRLAWRHFYGAPDGALIVAPRHAPAPYAEPVLPPEHSWWTRGLRVTLRRSYDACIARQAGRPKWWCQKPGLLRWALQDFIDEDKWIPIVADKGGGFILCSCRDLWAFRRDVISKSWYIPASENDVDDVSWRAACTTNQKLANRIVDADLHHSVSDLCSSLKFGQRRSFCTLTGTIKSHKDPGDVCMRPIHAASKYSFSSLGAWVASRLQPRLRNFSQLVSSPSEFLGKVMNFVIDPGDVLFHWNINDFYMAGSAAHHLHHTPLMLRRGDRELVKQALAFLLGRQFVRTTVDPDEGPKYYKMEEGAGQGLNYASTLSSCSFLHAVELTGARIACSDVHRQFSIKLYLRLADN